jgi:acetyl esterase/lipase
VVPVRSVINIYGPCDLAMAYDNGDSLSYGRAALDTYLGGSPAQFPERYRLLSPVSHVSEHSPPTLMLLGTRDRIVPLDQAETLGEVLKKAGVPHEIILLSAADHGFDMNWGGISTQIARAKILGFLAKHDPKPAEK